MSEKLEKFGLVTWEEEVAVPRGNVNRKRDEFMRLLPGNNKVRLLTKPFQYWSHKYKEEGDKGFGDKIYCSKFHGSCPLCDKGDKAKKRWFVGIIDRATNTYKVLDIGVAIFQKIQGYSRDEDWGDPTAYDVDIVVNKSGGATGYYNVIPKPKTALSSLDIEIKEKVDFDDLKRRCAPPTPEEVQKRLDRLKARVNGAAQVVESDDSGDDESFSFPPADQQSASA